MSAHMSASGYVTDLADMTVDVRRSSIDEQGIVTTIKIGDVRVATYQCDGILPLHTARRLRELADEIESQEIALLDRERIASQHAISDEEAS